MNSPVLERSGTLRIIFASAFGTFLCAANPATAQETASAGASDQYVVSLKTCQAIADSEQRLACFDKAVGEIVAANDAGDVRIIDREDIRNTRRQLFGLAVPEVGVLERDEKDAKEDRDLLETSITSVRYISAKQIRFTTTEGSVWEINRPPNWFRGVKEGDSVVFKKGALSSYFIRVNGQMGVKGKRVQ